jgi:hypothetical protein
MLTNILATITVLVSTNTYSPKQYWQENNAYSYDTNRCALDVASNGSWMDESKNPLLFQLWRLSGCGKTIPTLPLIPYFGGQTPQERDNPDVRITEIREIKKLSFEYNDKTWLAEISNIILSIRKERRKVETKEEWIKEEWIKEK